MSYWFVWSVLQYKMGNFVKFCQQWVFLPKGWFFVISSSYFAKKIFGAVEAD